MASFTPEGHVIVDNKDVYKGKQILIATGGRPTVPNFPGTALYSSVIEIILQYA